MSSTALVPLFFLRGVRAAFDGTTVLRVDELRIGDTGVTVLVGENGAGKSTLLRLLNALLDPAEGVIEFRGKPLGRGASAARAELRAQSVMVHQAPVLFRGTVLQNVTYGLRIRGMARAERARRAGRALDLVGAGSLARRRTSGLSGGEQHRVALARALVLEPSVLLLDEPTAHADPDSRAAIERVIRSLPGAGTKVIASTHLMDTAYRLCDELVRLESGRVAPARENIIKGAVERTEESLSLFRPAFSGSPLILCPARQGSFSVAVIPMDELIFSREPLSSSARNNLRGRVTGVEQQEGLLRVDVDCGVALSGLITRAASAELAVEKGRDIVVTFKASAVRLF